METVINMESDPRPSFPLKRELREAYDKLGYILQLAGDWEELIAIGMDPSEAEKYIRRLADQNLDLRAFR